MSALSNINILLSRNIIDALNNASTPSGTNPFVTRTSSALTATRVPYVTAGGHLIDSANMTFDGSLLSTLAHDLTGTAGAGYLGIVAQSSAPAAPAATGLRLFSDSTGGFGWVIKNGIDTYVRQIASTLTANRTYTLPDASIVIAGSASALTNTRIPYVTAGGLLIDSSNLTFNGTDTIGVSGSNGSMTLTGGTVSPSMLSTHTASSVTLHLDLRKNYNNSGFLVPHTQISRGEGTVSMADGTGVSHDFGLPTGGSSSATAYVTQAARLGAIWHGTVTTTASTRNSAFVFYTMRSGAAAAETFRVTNYGVRWKNVTAPTAASGDMWFDGTDLYFSPSATGRRVVLQSTSAWTNPTGVLTRSTFDTTTATLTQVAERLAALITDLKANNTLS